MTYPAEVFGVALLPNGGGFKATAAHLDAGNVIDVALARSNANSSSGQVRSLLNNIQAAPYEINLGTDGEVSGRDFGIGSAQIVGRHIFYNNSAFDDESKGKDDNDAIAPDPSQRKRSVVG